MTYTYLHLIMHSFVTACTRIRYRYEVPSIRCGGPGIFQSAHYLNIYKFML